MSRPNDTDSAGPPGSLPPADAGERLSKRLARMLRCSRSDAERYIEAGYVTVDGVVVDLPQYRVLDQKIELSPDASLAPAAPVTLLLNKPAGIDAGDPAAPPVLALLDPKHRAGDDPSQMRPVARHRAHQRCLTPLEASATGLVVFSQDPRIERKLLEEAWTIEHETMVDVTGDVSAQALELLAKPFMHRGRTLPAARVSISRQAGDTTGLRIAAKGHAPGRIEQACEAAGLRVTAIRRIRIGRLPLAGLPVGTWRYLLPTERF